MEKNTSFLILNFFEYFGGKCSFSKLLAIHFVTAACVSGRISHCHFIPIPMFVFDSTFEVESKTNNSTRGLVLGKRGARDVMLRPGLMPHIMDEETSAVKIRVSLKLNVLTSYNKLSYPSWAPSIAADGNSIMVFRSFNITRTSSATTPPIPILNCF